MREGLPKTPANYTATCPGNRVLPSTVQNGNQEEREMREDFNELPSDLGFITKAKTPQTASLVIMHPPLNTIKGLITWKGVCVSGNSGLFY